MTDAEAKTCPPGPQAMARAMGYIEEVHKRFLPDREESYQQFMKTFADYWKGDRDIEHVQNRIKELLKDHPDLIEGFEKFLPTNDQSKGLEGDIVERESIDGEQRYSGDV